MRLRNPWIALWYFSDPGWVYLRQSPEQALADQTKPYDSKKNVWIADPDEGYIAAEIKAIKGDMCTVTTAKGNEVMCEFF